MLKAAALLLLLLAGPALPAATPPGFAAAALDSGPGFALVRYERTGTDPVVAYALTVDPKKRRVSVEAFPAPRPYDEIQRDLAPLAFLNGGFYMIGGGRHTALGRARGRAGSTPSAARTWPLFAVAPDGRPSVTSDLSLLDRKGYQALQSKPRVLYDGKISPRTRDAKTTKRIRQPRAGVGILKDGRLLLVVVEGRGVASAGMTLLEFARLLRDLGCRDALGMDGGGSALLVVRGRPVNTPSGGFSPFTLPGEARPLLDGIFVK